MDDLQGIAACMLRKRTFLDTPEWKTIPWTRHPKTPKDLMIDILMEIPAVLEDLDLLRSNTHLQDGANNQLEIYRRFMETYVRVDRQLIWWLETLAPLDQLNELQLRDYENPTVGDFVTANIMGLFWACCILTYGALHLAISCSPPSVYEYPEIDLDEHTNPRPYCTKIADIGKIFLQSSVGIISIFSAPFPIAIALQYLMSTEGLESKDGEKLLGYLTCETYGTSLASFIGSSLREWPGPRLVPPTRRGGAL
jgi:hypothetical protein